jgi:hypothetical protein
VGMIAVDILKLFEAAIRVDETSVTAVDVIGICASDVKSVLPRIKDR